MTRTRISPESPEANIIGHAADILASGGLVAFPTETVYGLGATALNPKAVQKIFTAKGRPSTNPLIVHVGSLGEAKELVSDWPKNAELLAEAFWPGPLTLVLRKNARIPAEVTGGGATVAIRVPAHAVALALIHAAGPLAAPSANRSGSVSAVRAEHVEKDLGEEVKMILDAGQTTGGIESTVLDVTVTPPRLLRPGLVSVADIERIIGTIDVESTKESLQGPLPSPGMLKKHYAPKTKMILGTRNDAQGRTCLSIGFETGNDIVMPRDPSQYAGRLYDALHQLDTRNAELIVCEPVPETNEWLAVRDRLQRATST